MSRPARMTRRQFLRLGAAVLGGAALACSAQGNRSDCPVPPCPYLKTSLSLEGNTMTEKILVVYASRAGSTAGVAEAIGKTLAARGAAVDVRPMQQVSDFTPYRAVVAGSAIQGGKWLPEAMQFVEDQRTALAQRPFAAFLVCMTLAMKNGEAYRSHVATWMQPVRSLVRPVSEGLFAGALEIAKIPAFADRLKFRLSVLLGVWPEGDQRDWGKIQMWAEGLRL